MSVLQIRRFLYADADLRGTLRVAECADPFPQNICDAEVGVLIGFANVNRDALTLARNGREIGLSEPVIDVMFENQDVHGSRYYSRRGGGHPKRETEAGTAGVARGAGKTNRDRGR